MEEFTFLSNWLLWLIAAAILVIVELLRDIQLMASNALRENV